VVRFTHIALALSLLTASVAFGATKALPRTFDSSIIPVSLNPSPGTITRGQRTTITVNMSGVGSSATVVSLSSSNTNDLPVPSTMTIQSGQSSGNFQTLTPPPGEGDHGRFTSSVVTVTATANGVSKDCQVTVN